MARSDQAKPAQETTTKQASDEEAKNLAREAMEELDSGNREEAQFVLKEARELDPDAVEEVVAEHDKAAKKR